MIRKMKLENWLIGINTIVLLASVIGMFVFRFIDMSMYQGCISAGLAALVLNGLLIWIKEV